ncbi:MAG: hypothetical protein C4523_01120 [Myxococcales bacterium]|nr:MAG: hypothetical protein C4523_01120 [Myxococcales bacterium]
MSHFHVKDCTLIVQTTKIQAINLRELREGISRCEAASIYHHFYETLLRPSFDDPVYQSDFAIWSARELHDPVLAERLSIIDPYAFEDIESLRAYLLDILDDRLSEVHFIPWARPEHQFYFTKAVTVVFDAGKVIHGPEKFLDGIRDLSLGSIFYHFIEARRRHKRRTDDFTVWLEGEGEKGEMYLAPLKELHRSLVSLAELKERLVNMEDSLRNNDGGAKTHEA